MTRVGFKLISWLKEKKHNFKEVITNLDDLNISKERKNEIDNISEENQLKLENGDSLKEFMSKHEIRKEELKKMCDMM